MSNTGLFNPRYRGLLRNARRFNVVLNYNTGTHRIEEGFSVTERMGESHVPSEMLHERHTDSIAWINHDISIDDEEPLRIHKQWRLDHGT